MAEDSWDRGRLQKLTREELLEEILDLLRRCDAAEKHFLFAGGRKGERAEHALYLIRPELQFTEAAPQSDQIVWDIWRARRDGLSLSAAIEKVAKEQRIAPQSVKATYYKHKGPNGLPKR